ncbi:hypothetical protein KAR91_78795 [Candidatus Pacearchaeota archaeon]|nr:hypothetical protein [Candidatus Pacearchaeota archaeon]
MRTLKETEQIAETEGDHTESLKTIDKQAIEDPKLVNTVQERLDNLNDLTKDDDFNRLPKEKTAAPEEEQDGSTPEPEDGSELEGDGQAEPEEKPDGSTPEAETKDEIPDAYIRAAIHQKWSQKDVDELVESNPELARRTFENCYNSVVQASRDFSEIGRAKIELDRQQADVQTAPQTATEVVEDSNTTALIAKLQKEYPDDPLIDVVVAGLKSKPKPVQTQPVSQQQQGYEVATARHNAAANAAIDQRVNSFFGADDMKLYDKFYGKLELGQIPEDLSNGQQQNRLAVLQEAEFIMAGHGVRGQKIEVEQAMERAHLIVTEPIRTQIVRDSLKATATKRKKSMTLRPSESKRSSDNMNTDSSKPRNKRELEQSVQQHLNKVFKS